MYDDWNVLYNSGSVYHIKTQLKKYESIPSKENGMYGLEFRAQGDANSLSSCYNLLNSHYDTSQGILRKSTCDSSGSNSGPWRGRFEL